MPSLPHNGSWLLIMHHVCTIKKVASRLFSFNFEFLAIRSTKTSCFVIPFLCSGVFGAKAIVVLAEKLGRLAVQLVAGGSGYQSLGRLGRGTGEAWDFPSDKGRIFRS